MMVAALRRELGSELTWPDPRGGFFLWARLPEGLDADAMVPRAVDHGVVYVAGTAFYVNGAGSRDIRLAFSAATVERITEGVRRLAVAMREELAALPAGSSSPAAP